MISLKTKIYESLKETMDCEVFYEVAVNHKEINNPFIIYQFISQVPIQSLCPDDDDFEWVDYKTVWASVEPLRAREFFAAQQELSNVTTRIRIRYIDPISHLYRVKFKDKIYNIISVIDPRTENRELQLMCSDGVNEG